MEVKNLGLVKAIFVSVNPPENKDVLWRDIGVNPPIHKYYNTTSGNWEALINSVLIDNYTIKKDGEGKIYVDISTIPELQIPDGSIVLAKLVNVSSGTVFYRKSPGEGSPEVQTLQTLKEDLGLSGINTGDQDLSGYVLKITTINGKPLSGNIVLTPEDIGSPYGSGYSEGTNTGDETRTTILEKLEIPDISGLNTGDETYESILELFGIIEPDEDYYLLSETERERLIRTANIYKITLPSSTTVQGRISGAVEGEDYPDGWVLSEGNNPVDILVEHGLERRVASVTVFSIEGDEERQLFGSAAFSGVITLDENTLRVESLATIKRDIGIYILFA